jgi:glycosyltransferase involved in cell wall biosynthesis
MSRPRILYLLKKFPRLSETFILNEILGQEALGADITVISRRAPDAEPRHAQLADLRAQVEVMPDPTVLDPLTELFLVPDVDSPSLEGVRELVRSMQPYGHPRLTRLVGEALWLRRRVRELGIGHVHVHFATESAVAAHMLHELGGPTYSITAHAKDIYRSTVDPRLLSHLIAGSTFTVTVCDANVRHIETMVSAEAMSKVRRLYNGIDLDRFRPSDAPREKAHILSVGRLVPKKGFDVLIDAARELARRGREFRLTLVGDGEERGRLQQTVEQHGLSDRVRLTGALEQEPVRELMSQATLLCLPCLIGDDGNRDALPTVLLEALASGLPVVSTPVTGIPEIVNGGRVGVLVPERDAVATADAIERLFDDEALRDRFAELGRVHAEEHFDARASARTLFDWFEAALCRPIS